MHSAGERHYDTNCTFQREPCCREREIKIRDNSIEEVRERNLHLYIEYTITLKDCIFVTGLCLCQLAARSRCKSSTGTDKIQ